jgi:hypothetical protein
MLDVSVSAGVVRAGAVSPTSHPREPSTIE